MTDSSIIRKIIQSAYTVAFIKNKSIYVTVNNGYTFI